jgi:energy-coupling factor transporter ATP-binding protein EcfA2
MKIKRFDAIGLHGYLNFALEFRPDLVFLTGINGAGKTSAVRSMTALLAPSLTTLVGMIYKSIAVTVEHEGSSIIIEAQRTRDEVLLSCGDVSEPLHIPILRPDRFETRSSFSTRMRTFYSEQLAVNAQNPTMNALDHLPTPMFLDLERRYQEGTRQRHEASRHAGRIVPSNPLAGSLTEGLEEAGDLADRAYRQYSVARTSLTDNLKQEIILAAFRRPDATGQFEAAIPSPAKRKDFLKKTGNNESVILPSLYQIGIPKEKVQETVLPFFAEVREVVSSLPSEKEFRSGNVFEDDKLLKTLQRWSAIQPLVRQIDSLVDLIGKYNESLAHRYAPIDRYLASVNSFLEDSGKQLGFDPTGNLRVRINEYSQSQPISALSSGERQLVVILSHLAFNDQAKRANVLIIDEPELSLHLRWQELFVDAVISASPGIQLILATHSPSIIKGRIEHCIDVKESQHVELSAPEAAQ